MDITVSCRMCAGIADPGVSLLDNTKQALAKWIENNLGYEISENNGYPTRVCHPCLTCINNWIMFCQRYKRAQVMLINVNKPNNAPETEGEDISAEQEAPEKTSANSKGLEKTPVSVTSKIKKNISPKVTIKTEKSSSQTLLDSWLDKSPTNKTQKNYEKAFNLKPLCINISNLNIKTEIKVEKNYNEDTSKTYVHKPGPKSKQVQIKKEKFEIKEETGTDIQNVSKALTSALLNKFSQKKPDDDKVISGRVTKKPRPGRFSKVKQELIVAGSSDGEAEEITLE